ncbi:DUF2490 domain-containing protein [Muricauda sp. CAU 1633]|uniref:DUF2490 domain-containing protein n=1 Tax=Allomuricauda sp. CAU 1633 TaxID=2816036 RepID=UPI001A8FEDE5|nr:DUF2490 domain-containing protein [Muricauda sp. CAU 1633]MBO0322981.1 DUF2490 domain-containing protein [Muricauda sp. CAU 1633]
MGFTKCYFSVLCSVVLLIASQNCLYGQDFSEHQPGSWFVLSGNTKIHEQWSIPTVAIIKNNTIWENYGFSFVRTGASFNLDASSTFTGGVAFLNMNSYTDTTSPKNSSQFWIYGEYSLKSKFGKSSISQRWRVENYRPIHSENASPNNRVRYRLQFVRPVHKNVYFKCYNEIILNLEEETFNQNRLFIGMGQKLTPSLSMDIGYLNRQFSKVREDMVQVGLSFYIDLTKKDLALLAEANP